MLVNQKAHGILASNSQLANDFKFLAILLLAESKTDSLVFHFLPRYPFSFLPACKWVRKGLRARKGKNSRVGVVHQPGASSWMMEGCLPSELSRGSELPEGF